ncbi:MULTISPECIES: response regulator [unclassified Acidovorax]|uniref:response regulator n=1 Tax=unclassified Acidovorax TaxID=2684926 RepID=UPI00070AD9D7|nr:response regulator transcription factor [Acidovorax sp. Root219]KRC31022.1 two-component system response regulator [Acidovorax sp. Root219]
MIRCLLVDDDPAIRTLLLDYLGTFGFITEAVGDGRGMRAALARQGFDVVLLDLMLPDEDGLTLCQWVRRDHGQLPVIVLTAQGDPMSRVLGLELGADDYLSKPFEPRELVARIKAVLRRGTAAPPQADAPQVRFEGWTFDRLRRELVSPDGTMVALSSAEFRLLEAFTAHAGKVLSRDRLLDLSRAPGVVVSDRSIDLAVSRLRGKLGEGQRDRPLIRTLRGEGYLFDVEVQR